MLGTLRLTVGELALDQSPILQKSFSEVDVLLSNAQRVRSDRYSQQVPDQEVAGLRYECRFKICSVLILCAGEAEGPCIIR